jgi:Lar family restriction alleviation protein
MPENATNEPPWTLRSLNLGDNVRLRSCPFCSSKDLGLYEYTYAKLFTVDCRKCGAQGPRHLSARRAQALWNGRAEKSTQ